ncbi:MAG: NADP-dependent phosphogluconate dehydrogenase [Gemmataceae bacterium]
MSDDKKLYRIGMVGLGVMGRSLVLNMADHGFAVAGYDREPAKGQALGSEGAGKPVTAVASLAELVAALEKPRTIVLLVPDKAVDAGLADLLKLVEPGDLVIDAGNSFFKDTDRRGAMCKEKGVNFFGMGVSGGEAGARHGPAMMPGGPKESYERVHPVLEAIAAKVNGDPCVGWVGTGSAGHYVKMVHNGIEYGLMQLIAETYDILRRGVGLSNDELHATFAEWNRGELASFLIEITATIFLKKDDKGGNGRLLDMVKDVARQKGTGKWTSQDALDLTVPIPTIDLAVMARNLSGMADERKAVHAALGTPVAVYAGDRPAFVRQVGQALYASFILSYAQGLDLLRVASKEYGYGVDLAEVARIWRGGCIIRSALLQDIRTAYSENAGLPSLLAAPSIVARLKACDTALRQTIRTAIEMGVPVPCLMGSLAYLDELRSGGLPTNLIQAQRDFFGAHTYERIDSGDKCHSLWDQP